jgi:hypothetical protein
LTGVAPPSFRGLYERIMGYDGTQFRTDLLAPWLREHSTRTAEWFTMIGEQSGDPFPASISDENLWDLYAFSRVNDALRIDFQPFSPHSGAPEHWREWFGLTVDDYQDFVAQCGLEVLPPGLEFSPFGHEIVTVEQSQDHSAPIRLDCELWPTVVAGRLLISRAGACVTAGRAQAAKEVAENSTLYWAYLRRNRKCADLSLGWGSNSQWRTGFRRDYLSAGQCHLNVDGDPARAKYLGTEDPADRQRVELLIHRCLVTLGRSDDDDLWPYDDHFCGPSDNLNGVLAHS